MPGTTLLLALHHENLFFTEHVTRHFQRLTDDSVELLLIGNESTSTEVLELADFLAQHERTHLQICHGASDRPIGTSIDAALGSGFAFRERLLFTHMDLVYLEPCVWECEELEHGAKMVSGRFVQEPLWYDGAPDPLPRPADDHLIADTRFYFDNGLVFRSYDRADMAYEDAPWLRQEIGKFRRADGSAIDDSYPLDPFNLSHLALAWRYGAEVGKLWAYHFPRQCHVNSILRVFRAGVRRREDERGRHLYLPADLRRRNGGYQWKALFKYSIFSSYLFNSAVDYVVPAEALARKYPRDFDRLWRETYPALRFFQELTGPLPYRVQADICDPKFHLHDRSYQPSLQVAAQ